MAVTEEPLREQVLVEDGQDAPLTLTARRRDLQRTFQLCLAVIWLLDAVLQIQPFMFTPGKNGFSGMIGGSALGTPGWIADTITWNASIVDHHPVLTNTLFALIQFLIAFGIIWRRTCKVALGLSVAWAIGVWWFGEGLGGIFAGTGTPLGGGPGAVLFYALLAVLLWPKEGSDAPFVAARTVGARTAKMVWLAVWAVLAVLCLVGSGRSPQTLQSVVAGTATGGPGWLVHLDRYSASLMLHHGTALAIVLAAFCCVAALGVYLPPTGTRVVLVLIVVAFSVIWVAVQNVGGILAGGATDPNSGPLVILLALAYWPRRDRRGVPAAPGSPTTLALSFRTGTSTGRLEPATASIATQKA